jgi:hypothetical protein
VFAFGDAGPDAPPSLPDIARLLSDPNRDNESLFGQK